MKGKEQQTQAARTIPKFETDLFFLPEMTQMTIFTTERLTLTFLKASALILRARLQTPALLRKWRRKSCTTVLYMLYISFLPTFSQLKSSL